MKRLLIILLAIFLTSDAQIIPKRRKPPAAAGGCTLNAGNLYNESWEGSDTLSWTDTGTVDRNAALSGTSPCSGLGSECAEVNWNGSGGAPYTTWNRGSLLNSTLYFRFYFIIVSQSTANTDHYAIFLPGESSTPISTPMFRISINNVSSQLKIQAISGGSSTTEINVSVATWYRVELKYVVNSAGGSEFKLFDAAGSQIDTTKNWDTGNNWLQYIHVGLPFTDNSLAFRVQIDGLGVSDTGYIGQ